MPSPAASSLARNTAPAARNERSRWIRRLRGPKTEIPNPRLPQGFYREIERGPEGHPTDTATVLLTNRECPWSCFMCDLWRDTIDRPTPRGAIPAQLDHALAGLKSESAGTPLTRRRGGSRQIKLYNSGSFFDRRAVPPADYPAIAWRCAGFNRVIVECHPALIGEACERFQGLLDGRLEIAIGLETAHEELLKRLNKGFDLAGFDRAAGFLASRRIALRVFVLVNPPWLIDQEEALDWTLRSARFAFDRGASVVSLIPTRGGNGAMDALRAEGGFRPPDLSALETAHDRAMIEAPGSARVFADTWDLNRFSTCPACLDGRKRRLERMNLEQHIVPRVRCGSCRQTR